MTALDYWDADQEFESPKERALSLRAFVAGMFPDAKADIALLPCEPPVRMCVPGIRGYVGFFIEPNKQGKTKVVFTVNSVVGNPNEMSQAEVQEERARVDRELRKLLAFVERRIATVKTPKRKRGVTSQQL